MVRRNLRSDFVGGAYVFPGGAVDPLDGGAEAEALSAGRSDAGASTLLGVESGGLAYWVAVVRETFEEAGLLLARREGGPDLLAGDPEEEARFAAARAAVNAGTLRFLDLCREERLQLGVGDIHYFAHWITPRGAPRRYDTRFFVAAAPPGQIAAHDAGRDDRRGVDLAARRARPGTGPARSRSSSPPSATCRPSGASPPAPRCWRPRRGRRARSRPSSRGWCPTATACASCSRATRPTSGRPSPTPTAERPGGTSTRPCAPCPCGRTRRAPTPHPGPARGRRRDPGGAGLRHRPRPRAGPGRRGGTGRAAAHRPQPGAHDRAGHQHLSRRARRARRGRPRPGRRGPHGGHRRRGRAAGPVRHHRRHPHPRRPRAGRRRAGRAPPGPRSWASARPRGSSPTSAWARGGRCACPGPGPAASSRCGRCTRRATPRTTCAGSSRSTRCCSRATTSCTARPS